MKNVKLNLKKARKAGFSLVEMLVVIAIIGIIAAIAIPNIGNINQASKDAAAQRNAQQVASTYNAAIVAGATASADLDAALAAVQTGITIPDGPFSGKVFTVGDIDNDTEADVKSYLSFSDGNITYTK
jgi:type IV pilus assembly protein PilA